MTADRPTDPWGDALNVLLTDPLTTVPRVPDGSPPPDLLLGVLAKFGPLHNDQDAMRAVARLAEAAEGNAYRVAELLKSLGRAAVSAAHKAAVSGPADAVRLANDPKPVILRMADGTPLWAVPACLLKVGHPLHRLPADCTAPLGGRGTGVDAIPVGTVADHPDRPPLWVAAGRARELADLARVKAGQERAKVQMNLDRLRVQQEQELARQRAAMPASAAEVESLRQQLADLKGVTA